MATWFKAGHVDADKGKVTAVGVAGMSVGVRYYAGGCVQFNLTPDEAVKLADELVLRAAQVSSGSRPRMAASTK